MGSEHKHDRSTLEATPELTPEVTPDSLGFRMPAEWEPHRATWIAWPHNIGDWPGRYTPIPWVYGEIVRQLTRADGPSSHPRESVCILVEDAAGEGRARAILHKVGVDLGQVEFHRHRTDRVWTRDYAPLFVRNAAGEVAATKWRFNGWAKYPNHKLDDRIATKIAKALGRREFPATIKGEAPLSNTARRAVLEGGIRSATLAAATNVRVAVASPDQIDHDALLQLAEGHRRET